MNLIKRMRGALADVERQAAKEQARVAKETATLRARLTELQRESELIKSEADKQRAHLTAALTSLESAGTIPSKQVRRSATKSNPMVVYEALEAAKNQSGSAV